MALQRIDVQNADPTQQAEAAATAAAVIARGGLVVLPTETVYGLAADPRQPDQIARVQALKGRAAPQEFTHHLADARDAARLGASLSPQASRLAARYWPGPLTLIVATAAGPAIGLRVPAHPLTQAVIATCGPSLFLTSVNQSGSPPLVDPDAIAAAFGDDLDLLLDAGPPPLRVASTIVRCTGPALEVLREGILTRAEILDAAARHVLFVCTGNTCRSPMAEALARSLVAHRLGIEPDAVLAHGFGFASAGLYAADGEPASEHAVAALAEAGLELQGHASRSLDAEAVARADRIFCMTEGHRDRLLALAPDAAGKVQVLRRDGADIADPFGASLDRYRAARDEIRAELEARLSTLVS